jgi:hypothetical protein
MSITLFCHLDLSRDCGAGVGEMLVVLETAPDIYGDRMQLREELEPVDWLKKDGNGPEAELQIVAFES